MPSLRAFATRLPEHADAADLRAGHVEDRAPSGPRDAHAKDALDREQAVALVYAAQGKN